MSATAKSPARRPPVSAEMPALVVKHRGWLLVGVMGAMIMQVLDTTIANVALPHMQSSLSATQDTVTWVLTSYVLASAVALPLAGWLVSRLGTRTMLLGSVTLFTLASILCGLAQSLEQMVLFRVLQGLAGAFLGPLAQTVTIDTSTPSERPRMMALFTQGVMLGPIAGPILGGYLTENFDWRWVFFVNIPLGVACLVIIGLCMPRTFVPARKIDLMGWALVAGAVSGLQLMLDRGPSQDWFASGEVVSYFILSLSCFWMGAVHFATARNPLFPPAMFTDRNFLGGLVFTFIMGMTMMSVMALLPSLLQTIYRYPVIDAGLLLAPRGVGTLVFIMLFSQLMAKSDPRILLACGFSITGFSFWLMTGWTVTMPTWPIVLSGFIQGVGMSLVFIPANLITFATLPPAYRTDASGLVNMMRNLGASIGIAMATFLLGRSIQINHAELGSEVTRLSVPFDLDRITAYGDASTALVIAANGMINQQAAIIAYLNDFLLMAIVSFAAIPLIVFLKSAKGPLPAAKAAAGGSADEMAEALH